VPVTEVLLQLGGVAGRAQLLRHCERPEVDRALTSGDVVAVARGRYALPAADEALVAAHRVGGVVSHRSAALRHGWPVLVVPRVPDVVVPKHRRLSRRRRAGVGVRWIDLAAGEEREGVTSRDRTVVDCLRSLPFLEALAVADSALREGFGAARLRALASGARGPGSVQVREVARAATSLAANPFESGLRGIALSVEGLSVRPQVSVHDPGFLGRPDLVDERLGIVVEAESLEWHGGRIALARDCRRYNTFGVRGWLVLRFSWEDVMFHPDEVRQVLEAAVELRTEALCPRCRAA
jgi:very-short-patch-repair endonuclease